MRVAYTAFTPVNRGKTVFTLEVGVSAQNVFHHKYMKQSQKYVIFSMIRSFDTLISIQRKHERNNIMKIAVCDDCSTDAIKLKTLLPEQDTTIYTNAEELLIDIEQNELHFDLYLLDIYIDNSIDGIYLAKRIRIQDKDAVICFVSTSDDFYREAYDVYAIQYLIKPVNAETMGQLIERVSRNIARNKERSLQYSWRGQAGSILYGKILYINSREHTLFIHCKDGKIQKCKGKLEEMAEQICGEIFSRCHQSFIANMYQVDRMEGNELILAGYHIPISRRYYKEIKRQYQKILFEEVD